MGTIKAKYRNSRPEFYSASTQETVLPVAPMWWHHRFVGSSLDTTHVWSTVDVGAGTTSPALIDGEGGGACAIRLDATSEAQDSAIYFGDVRPFDLNANLIFEARVLVKVLPTTGVKCVLGMAGDHNLDKDSITEAAWFSMAASGAVLAETDDTTNNNDDKSTGITATTTADLILRIDFTTLSDVRFYINGASVATGTTFDMSNLTAAEAMMQPYFSLDKASGTGVGTVYIRSVDIWSDES